MDAVLKRIIAVANQYGAGKPFCSVHAPAVTVREKAIMTLLSVGR